MNTTNNQFSLGCGASKSYCLATEQRVSFKRVTQIFLLATAILAIGVYAPSAQTITTAPAIYRLNKDATFQKGCFGPCLCPVLLASSIRGTFVLTPAGFDPLFNYYRVSDVNWTVTLADSDVRVTGEGKYKLGGEFALQQ